MALDTENSRSRAKSAPRKRPPARRRTKQPSAAAEPAAAGHELSSGIGCNGALETTTCASSVVDDAPHCTSSKLASPADVLFRSSGDFISISDATKRKNANQSNSNEKKLKKRQDQSDAISNNKNFGGDCVENSNFTSMMISAADRVVERIKPKQWMGSTNRLIDLRSLSMSLRCGLVGESSWALDTLAVLLADDDIAAVNAAFQISPRSFPRSLFDSIVDWLAVLLYQIFPHEFESCMLNLRRDVQQQQLQLPLLNKCNLNNDENSENDDFSLEVDSVPSDLHCFRSFLRPPENCSYTISFDCFCGGDKTANVTNTNPSRAICTPDCSEETEENYKVVNGPKSFTRPSSKRAQSPTDSGTTSPQPAAVENTDFSDDVDCNTKLYAVTDIANLENITDVFNHSTRTLSEMEQRLAVILQILRNLSFVPGNDAIMARHVTMLRFMSRLLFLPTTIHSEAKNNIYVGSPNTVVGQLREHAFVILSNCAGYIELIKLPDKIVNDLLRGLLYWSTTTSNYTDIKSDEPFTSNDHESLKNSSADDDGDNDGTLAQRLERLITAKRIAIECLAKLTAAHHSNIDLIVTIDPSFTSMRKLFRTLSQQIALGRQDGVMREACLCILGALVLKSEDYVVNALAEETPEIFGHVLSFVEQIENSASSIASMPNGISMLRKKPELMGTSLACLRRCGEVLYEFVRKLDSDYHYIIFGQQQRILELLMSQALEQQVANNLAKIMLRLQSPVDVCFSRCRSQPLPRRTSDGEVANDENTPVQ